jgi:iron complex outermembrane recepter protein
MFQTRLALIVVTLLVPAAASAQPSPTDPAAQAGASQPAPAAQAPDQTPGRITLPTVTVTAQKEPADVRTLPASVTALSSTSLERAGISLVSDGAIYAPNTYFSDFTARKLTNARFRGIGSSPANPAVTTFIDGVPQLNSNSASIDFLDVSQLEFVRGPQSALFGRNTLGGLVNVMSARPSLTGWTGGVAVPFGNEGARDFRGRVSGPLGDTIAVGLALGYGERDGFTRNPITGNDIDSRSAWSGKGQLLWTPAANWEARVIVSGERARDGDYALNDLAALRTNPFEAARDFEGRTDRDLLATTVLTRREGQRFAFSTTTGFVRWKTQDLTDLDYTPAPLITRDNTERDFQFTQEVRLASAAAAPVRLSNGASLKWQTGLFIFSQQYEQDAINTFSPFLLSPSLGFEIDQHTPQGTLDDLGVGVYGQGTLTINERLDLSLGARVDHEQKEAVLDTFFEPQFVPAVSVNEEASFSSVSPQVALAYRFEQNQVVYATAGRGFKAGGFNPASPVGSEAYGKEHTWNLEGGVKASWAEGKISANAALFSIEWDDLQLNLPNVASPGQFYIANVGGATSRGVEIELSARPTGAVDIFGALGYTRARFGDGSSSSGADVSGNKIPNTPEYTATVGAQLTRPVGGATLYGRGEMVFYGAFEYDDANSARQDAYSLANFRAGVRGRLLFAEGWIRNAFDTRYIPVAFAYGPFAPSGFVGESGRPRTFGVSAGVSF